jgi:MFS transporter, NNP family, nitrate/nitrite transporter
VGACGGYLIPRSFGASIAATGGPHVALAFYVTCLAITWRYYLRRGAPGGSSLAEARVRNSDDAVALERRRLAAVRAAAP